MARVIAPHDRRAAAAAVGFPRPRLAPAVPRDVAAALAPISANAIFGEQFAAVTSALDLQLDACRRYTQALAPALDHHRELTRWYAQSIAPAKAALDHQLAEIAPVATVLCQRLGLARRQYERSVTLLTPALGQQLEFSRRLARFVAPLNPVLDLQVDVRHGLAALRNLDNLVDVSRVLNQLVFGRISGDLWRELRHLTQRVPFGAVCQAHAAMLRGDYGALEEFLLVWLGMTPTPPRLEALVEALLEVDIADYTPDDGSRLLADVRARVRLRTTRCRREHGMLLDLRRGAGTIVSLGDDVETTVVRRVGLPDDPPVENIVLDRLQPDVDPRVVELVNELPMGDRTIAMVKMATGCSWAAAAAAGGQPAERGEVIRRRLHRRRAALPPIAAPWSELPLDTMSRQERARYGHLHPTAIVVDGHPGIWP